MKYMVSDNEINITIDLQTVGWIGRLIEEKTNYIKENYVVMKGMYRYYQVNDLEIGKTILNIFLKHSIINLEAANAMRETYNNIEKLLKLNRFVPSDIDSLVTKD